MIVLRLMQKIIYWLQIWPHVAQSFDSMPDSKIMENLTAYYDLFRLITDKLFLYLADANAIIVCYTDVASSYQ